MLVLFIVFCSVVNISAGIGGSNSFPSALVCGGGAKVFISSFASLDYFSRG